MMTESHTETDPSSQKKPRFRPVGTDEMQSDHSAAAAAAAAAAVVVVVVVVVVVEGCFLPVGGQKQNRESLARRDPLRGKQWWWW